jgi:transcriptional regulator with XRE-family HTH domain
MNDIKKRFGKRLRKLRRNKDLTQEQLADMVGVSLSFIGQLERGESGPSLETVQKIAEVLEVDISEFFPPPEKKD